MSKRITTEQLHNEIKILRDNHIYHLHECVHRLESDVKDNRKFFTQRLDRLDNRIFWILGLVVSTLIAIIGVMIAP